jgi:hypothetical protein
VALDRLLVECSRRGLRLLPTLTNYWKEYGGMAQYAKCATHPQPPTQHTSLARHLSPLSPDGAVMRSPSIGTVIGTAVGTAVGLPLGRRLL